MDSDGGGSLRERKAVEYFSARSDTRLGLAGPSYLTLVACPTLVKE
jgi:hypothetical protein